MYGYIRFIVANRNFNESCKVNEQCKGTTNANTCQYKEGEEGVCSCDKEYSFIIGECLKGKKNTLKMIQRLFR